MKNLATILITLALMLTFTVPPVGAQNNDENPSDTVCLTYPPAVVGCATGTIGHVLGACDPNGCTVTLTAHLQVTPVACGWMSWNDLFACAYVTPEPRNHDEPVFLQPGAYKVVSELCISDPTLTVTVPCKMLVHNFIVPASSANAGDNLQIVVDFGLGFVPDEPLPDFPDELPAVEDLLPDEPPSIVKDLLPGELETSDEGYLVYDSPTFRVYKADSNW